MEAVGPSTALRPHQGLQGQVEEEVVRQAAVVAQACSASSKRAQAASMARAVVEVVGAPVL
jgi:hypothetical protein